MPRRLLAIGTTVPRVRSISWNEAVSVNIVDYQGLLFDYRTLPEVSWGRHLFSALTTYIQQGHPVYVILPEAKHFQLKSDYILEIFARFGVQISEVAGSTIILASSEEPFLSYCKFLRHHEIVFAPSGSDKEFIATVVDNIRRAVCARIGSLRVFHPPEKRNETDAISVLVRHFGPDYEEADEESPPTWCVEVASKLPGMSEIVARTTALESRITSLENALAAERANGNILRRWADLLWLDGVALQNRVSDALVLLGFNVECKNPTDHTRDLVATSGSFEFLIEVTGSTGSITIEKGRQLLQWVTDSEDNENAKGVLIGNAFRKEDPKLRPPTPDQRMFTTKLEEFATKYHLALFDVRDLFELVALKLRTGHIELERLCEELSGDGVVKPTVSMASNSQDGSSLNASSNAR